MKLLLSCVITYLLATTVQSARILGIVPMASFSHQIVFWPIWRELSLRGHQLTVITTNPINDPSLTNLTEISIPVSYRHWGEYNYFQHLNMPPEGIWYTYAETYFALIDEQLSNPQVKKLIENEKETFDLLMIEAYHSAHFAFAERFKCPFISMTSLEANVFLHEEMHNPSNPVLYPDFMVARLGRLSFTERLYSIYYNLYLRCLNHFFVLPLQQSLVEKHFGKKYSSIQDIFRNFSAFFINTDTFFHSIRPFFPNVVQIGGGIHFTKRKPLPNDLQTLLDKSTDGVIYFSLGGNVKSKHMSSNVRQIMLDVFQELPYTVLWKFENDKLPGKPNNVIISKHFPQQDVLEHPNVKVFITQGGLQSIEEAIHANVPLIGIPVMGDQKSNVLRFVSKGIGVKLDYKSITKQSFKSTLLEVINNPIYLNNIKKLAELALDQPQTGLERAVWWTEYVIRHKGAYHLRNPSFDVPWYEYFMLDVIGLCLTLVLILFYLLYKILSALKGLCKNNVQKPKNKKM